MSEFRNAEPDAGDDDVRPKHSPLMSDQKDLAPASYKQKRSRTKKAPKASHSSLDNQQQPGAYRATADAAKRSKERRTSRESRAASSRADLSAAATTTRTRTTTTKGGGDGRNNNSKRRSKPRQPSMDENHKQSKTSTRSNLTALESDKKTATPSRTSTMTPGPPSLDRQMHRHVEPGAQAIAGSQAHLLHANDDDEESGYSFSPPDEPTTASKRDGVTVDLTEAHMVDDVEVYQDPVYAETVDVERQKLQERSNRRKYALWGFLAASLVAIGIALAVVFTRPDASATEAPSASPTVSDEFLPQFLATLSDPADLNNTASPQARAYDWIVNEDEVVLTGNQAKIQQRYAMAVLFYSTNGDTGAWETNVTWLNVTKPICNWTQSGTNVCDDNGLLREFTMDRNGMLGTIPTELALLSQSLSVLDLTINRLHGSLPTELGAMTLLETLHVSTNDLTGTIPTELGLLTNVRQLYVDANNIMDTMPQVICDLKKGSLEKLWADCTNDTNVVADVQCEVGVCCRCCFGLVCQ